MKQLLDSLGTDFGTLVGVVGGLLTLIAFLYFFMSEDRKRSQLVAKLENRIDRLETAMNSIGDRLRDQIDRVLETNKTLVRETEVLFREMRDLKQATEQVRPDFTSLVSNQWRFFDRMSRYRHEKLAICRRITERYIRVGDTLLLDSGSTTDLVTAELIARPIENITIFSNNVLAALHLGGTSVVRFSLLQGEFFQRSWAVYSDEANHRIDQIGATVIILAAATIRFANGIMVRQGEDGNCKFKRRAIEVFQQREDTRLIVAVDASKLALPIKGHQPVLPQAEWQRIVKMTAARITLVTSQIPSDLSNSARQTVTAQFEEFRAAGITVVVVDHV